MRSELDRRRFLQQLGTLSLAGALPGCAGHPEDRYNAEDVRTLARQREREAAQTGKGRFGSQRYVGYRGLATLPWFELDERGQLRCVDESVPWAIDFHCHLGISVLFAPDIDLQQRHERVIHLLDCDGESPGCLLDLDIYINGNFGPEGEQRLRSQSLDQGLLGSRAAATQTIPNLLEEMEAMRVERAIVLPIRFGWPFGDDLNERWREAIETAGVGSQLELGASVHPRDDEHIAQLERYAAAGARVVKLHPPMQRFYPDDPSLFALYEACRDLGLVIFFHAGRAGVEPDALHGYALPRHYEAALANFPELPFVLGHSGARDADGFLELALRHSNAWLGIHGQGVSHLDRMIERTGGARMLFGTDWPWYHLGATLAKVLIVTEGKPTIRQAILRQNAETLLAATG